MKLKSSFLFSDFLIIIFLINIFCTSVMAQTAFGDITIDVNFTLQRLMEDEDTDKDLNLTVNDFPVNGTDRGNKRFWLTTVDGKHVEVTGTYHLSNLLQELTLAREAKKVTLTLNKNHIFEPPADHISRNIRERFWDGLTRTIDEKGLLKIIADEKTESNDKTKYIYVPASDELAYSYYVKIAKRITQQQVKVIRLPEKITPEYVRALDGKHGILSLGLKKDSNGNVEGIPFVVPGGRFNEMYGWDSYFIVLGLLQDGRIDLAKAMVENFIYEISHYGAIFNANRTYYLTRSQPPFFTSMIRAVYDRLEKNNENLLWLKTAVETAMKEYHSVWMNSDRLTKTGLSRYYDSGYGQPPETEPGHFDLLYTQFAAKYHMTAEELETAYTSGRIKSKDLDEYFVNDRSMRESGNDTSYRLIGVSADLVTVDLNSLLYKYETDIAEIIKNEFNGTLTLKDGTNETFDDWIKRAEKRKELITRYLWNEKRGMFFDYNYRKHEQTTFVCATTLFPLWAGTATKKQAEIVVKNALPLLEQLGGISGSDDKSPGPITVERPQRQWDYPYGWSPHQILVWSAMHNYGYDDIARRLVYKWLFTITVNASQFNGTVPEKFDVVTRTHQVFAEYGNVGTKFFYITKEGFGWTNASYQIGLVLLTPDLYSSLNNLVPPEWIF